jgi:hypothetical protein
MIDHECESLVNPGSVALLLHGSDLQLSTWGIVLPYAYWAENSRRRDVADFNNSWHEYKRVPVLQFTSDEDWRLTYRNVSSCVRYVCDLEEFRSVDRYGKENWGWVKNTLYACSLRDGSRYYKNLLRELVFLASKEEVEFTKEMLEKENPMGRRLIAHAQAIRAWKTAYTEFRQKHGYEE